MTCDQQFEELMVRLNKAEARVIELESSDEALKAQVNELKQALCDSSYLLSGLKLDNTTDNIKVKSHHDGNMEVIHKTPEQCLNSVKSEAVCEFANKYCKNCTTDYQSQLSEDAWNHCEELGINNESPG